MRIPDCAPQNELCGKRHTRVTSRTVKGTIRHSPNRESVVPANPPTCYMYRPMPKKAAPAGLKQYGDFFARSEAGGGVRRLAPARRGFQAHSGSRRRYVPCRVRKLLANHTVTNAMRADQTTANPGLKLRRGTESAFEASPGGCMTVGCRSRSSLSLTAPAYSVSRSRNGVQMSSRHSSKP